jgi:hypothetical protein
MRDPRGVRWCGDGGGFGLGVSSSVGESGMDKLVSSTPPVVPGQVFVRRVYRQVSALRLAMSIAVRPGWEPPNSGFVEADDA